MPNAIPSLAIDLDDLALLLDVDGSILDLAPTPPGVRVPPTLRRTLELLSQRTDGAVAFVSGRKLSDLDLIFSPLQLPAIGGHGAELRVKAGDASGSPPIAPLDFILKRKLAAAAQLAPGIVVEDKGYSLALHYRLAPEKGDMVWQFVNTVCSDHPSGLIELLPGKLMVEVKRTGFNKATAVRELMTHCPFAGRRPIFIGDDVTDEVVFAIMPDFDGVAISVGEMPGVNYHFDRPDNVRNWLEAIARSGTDA